MKTQHEKRQLLIKALKIERNRFERNKLSTKDHDDAIAYLNNGFKLVDMEDGPLLDGVIYDFDCIYTDYCDQ